MKMNRTWIKERLEALLEVMEKKNVDYYLIPTADFHNSEYVDEYFKVREYFSGFTGSNGTLVVSRTETGLWTDGRYFIQAQQELEGTEIKLFRMMEEGVPTIAEYLEAKLTPEQCVGFDGRVVDTSFGKKLERVLSNKKARFYFEEDLAQAVWKERPALPANPVLVLPESLCGKTMTEKLTEVRKKMEEKDCAYLLLSKLDDLMWLLNIRGRDVECNPVALSYAFVTASEAYLFVQSEAVTEELKNYAEKNGVILKDYQQITAFLKDYPYQGSVLLDERHVSYLLYRIVTGRTEAVCAANPTEALKAVKNSTELAKMEEVYLRDSAVVTKFIYWLKQNIGNMEITELSAAAYLDGLRAKLDGYLDLSFPTISAYQENAAMMHYEAKENNQKTLKPEGMLLVDSGGQYLGGTTDVTRTIVLGNISPEIKRHYSAVAAGMMQLSRARFLHGCTGRNLDILARKPLWDMGIDYKCGTGHGVGYILNVHEGPQSIRWRFSEGMTEAVLEEGMTVTNEPGVYKEGSHGIRIENVMTVKNHIKNGDGQFLRFDTLTYVPLDREGLDKKFLSEEDRNYINEYHEEVYEKISQYLNKEEKNWLYEQTRPL